MPEHADWTSFQRELRIFDTRLEVLQEASLTTEGAMLQGAVLAELETCREELRVAEEELRVQHDELAATMARRATDDAQGALADLPVAVMNSDALGVLWRVNSATGRMFDRRPQSLVGKPLAAYVHEADRKRFRTVLSTLSESSREARFPVRLTPGGTSPIPVTMIVRNVGAPDHPDLRWLALPETGAADVADEAAAHLVILALASTPVLTMETDELVARITELTQRALAGADAVRVSLDGDGDRTALQLAFEIDGDDAAADHPITGRPTNPATGHKEAGSAHTAGNRPTLALPLSANGSTFGTLDVFTAGRRPLSTKDAALAKLCAQAAGAVLANAGAVASARKRVDNLNGALVSRAVIEQAKGAIMAMEGCSADEAFDRLRVISQRSNVKLRDVARQLLEAACKNGRRHAS